MIGCMYKNIWRPHVFEHKSEFLDSTSRILIKSHLKLIHHRSLQFLFVHFLAMSHTNFQIQMILRSSTSGCLVILSGKSAFKYGSGHIQVTLKAAG